jgi:hypothetical protein
MRAPPAMTDKATAAIFPTVHGDDDGDGNGDDSNVGGDGSAGVAVSETGAVPFEVAGDGGGVAADGAPTEDGTSACSAAETPTLSWTGSLVLAAKSNAARYLYWSCGPAR